MALLSIHSCVVRGHVGNSAAVFPLQCLGVEVWQVPTVILSNHPGHGRFTGSAIAADLMDTLVGGLEVTGALKACTGVLTGYFSTPEQVAVSARAIERVAAAGARPVIACDPVIGDEGKGLYVPEPVAQAVRDTLIPKAGLATPNAFELGWLTGEATGTPSGLRAAAEKLRAMGPDTVLVTSFSGPGGDDRIGMMLVDGQGASLVETPRLDLHINGAGDMAAALFTAFRMRGMDSREALGRVVNTVYAVVEKTAALGLNELAVLPGRDLYIDPPKRFIVRQLEDVL